MKDEAVRKNNELGRNTNKVFRLIRKIKLESTDLAGGRCVRENDGTLHLSERETAKIWKVHMSKIMNGRN